MDNPDLQFQPETEEIQEIQPTMIIGLGGTGKKILTRLKTRFFQAYNKVPDNVRLICFDIDPYEEIDSFGEYTVRLTPNEEFIDIGNVPAGGIVRQIRSNENLYPEIRTWLNTNIPLQESNLRRGGQQNRQLGRLALFWNVQTRSFITTLERIYLDLRRPIAEAGVTAGRTGNTVVVYIISSLAGGTGAGIALDTAFIMRYIADSVGLADQTSIVGVMILPRVFDMVKQEAIQPNALAALQEIDYFMQSPIRPRKLNEITYYADFSISCTIQPFNICYVVDAIGAGGKALVGVEHLFPMVVDAVFLLAASKMGTQAWSNINNLGRIFTGSKMFSSFGVASLVFPAFEIHHLCASKVSAEVIRDIFLASSSAAGAPEPTHREVDRFLTQLRLVSGDMLVSELGVGADGQRLRFSLQDDDRLSRSRLRSLERNQVHARLTTIVQELLAEWDLAARKRLETNRDTLFNAFESGINQRVREIVDSPERGIAAAQQFIRELKIRLQELEIETERVLREKEDALDRVEERLGDKDGQLKKAVLDKRLFRSPIEGRRDEYLEAAQDRMDGFVSKEVALVAKQAVANLLMSLERNERKLAELVNKLTYVKNVYLLNKENLYLKEIEGMDAVRRLPITRPQDIERIYRERKEGAIHRVIQSLLQNTGLLALADLESDQVGDAVFRAALESMKDIHQIQLEGLIQQRTTDRQQPITNAEWLSTVESNAEVFWRYEQAVSQAQIGLGQTIQVIGVEDTAKSIYSGQGTASRSYCSTENLHMITILQMEHGLDYRHMSQIRTYEANYRSALRQGRSPHIFPEFNYGSDDDHKWFALGVAYELVERRGPFWVMKHPEGEEEIQLVERVSLADAVWKVVHWPNRELLDFLKGQIDATMWNRGVTKQKRTTLLKQLKKFRNEFDWLGKSEDLESEWLKDKFAAVLDAHIREVEEYLAM